MADDKRMPPDKRIVSLPRPALTPEIDMVDHNALKIDELRAELRRELFSVHRGLHDATQAIRIHHETLTALVPLVDGLERATWSSRTRRAIARVTAAIEAQRVWWRGIGLELGLIDPAPRASERNAPDAHAAAEANPEAMPKP